MIPTHFSMDMRNLIKALLKTSYDERPDCGSIL